MNTAALAPALNICRGGERGWGRCVGGGPRWDGVGVGGTSALSSLSSLLSEMVWGL